jgi:hypothetical protein
MELLTPGIGTITFPLIVFLVIASLYLYTLIDVLTSKFEGNNKIVWLITVILLPFLGTMLYLYFGKGQKLKA